MGKSKIKRKQIIEHNMQHVMMMENMSVLPDEKLIAFKYYGGKYVHLDWLLPLLLAVLRSVQATLVLSELGDVG